jgi:demethylmenaquinone methyltransferase/2-methoxy-6-polyprenyl-1,4-benzoquinol methylase
MASSTPLESIIQQQLAYYRARAGEYDEWFYRLGDRYDLGPDGTKVWFSEVESVFAEVHALGPVDSVVELAAGTGNFTKELAKIVSCL